MKNNVNIYKTNGDAISKNNHLREFVHNSTSEYVLLYNSKLSLSENELEKITQKYIEGVLGTGIHFFVGVISPITIIDYGKLKLSVGSIVTQNININFFTRKALLANGYLDTRFTDNCQVTDYAHRLSVHKLYPQLSKETLPWVFDVDHGVLSQDTGHIFDNVSASWYQYKHQSHPLNLKLDEITNLTPALKSLKKIHDEYKS